MKLTNIFAKNALCLSVIYAAMHLASGAQTPIKTKSGGEISKIFGQAVNPPLFFPPGSTVRGIEFKHDNEEKVWQILYFATTPTSQEETYAFYRKRYKDSRAVWNGRQNTALGQIMAFTILEPQARKVATFTVIISKTANAPESMMLLLKPSEQQTTLISAHVDVAEAVANKLLKENVGFFIIPLPR